MDTLKKVNEANLEAEKAIHLKSRAKSAKEQRKQKKDGKRSRKEADLPENAEANAGEEDAAEKKRKRMAMYGV